MPAKKPRQHTSARVGIDLSVSRVRKCLDAKGVNISIEKAVADLKTEGKALTDETKALVDVAYATIYDQRKAKHLATIESLTDSKDSHGKPKSKDKAASDKKKAKNMGKYPVRTNTVEEKLDLVSKMRCRFSGDAAVALASGLDYLLREVVEAAMVHVRTVANMAIIQVKHAVDPSFTKLPVYPLIANLPVIKAAVADLENPDSKDDAKDDEAPEPADDSNGVSFEFYVNLICKRVRSELCAKDDLYKPIRIGQSIRKFGSDVVLQFIERIVPLIELYTETTKIKTVNAEVIGFIFELILRDAKVDSAPFKAYIAEKMAKFDSK
jgi:hypothetical protein